MAPKREIVREFCHETEIVGHFGRRNLPGLKGRLTVPEYDSPLEPKTPRLSALDEYLSWDIEDAGGAQDKEKPD
ncbi:MAG: hypothetical protein ACFB12_16270 [Leptolyngbyaceae cyanobacterium]